MNVVVAIDSMKGSLSSIQAGQAVRRGIMLAAPATSVQVIPIADGGEGTVEALVQALNGELVQAKVKDPLGRDIIAEYGIVNSGTTAVIEMAAAAGLPLLIENERDPYLTSTYGVGQLIVDAIQRGCCHFIIGIGGSATNDGGIGMLQALGVKLSDRDGKPVGKGAIGLRDIHTISVDSIMPELKDCTFRIACDVDNPLCGARGCSMVFAPQKGATKTQIEDMDMWLRKYAEITKAALPNSNMDAPGAGAAGGLGFALQSYLDAKLEPGIQIVMDVIGLEEKIKSADIVITGEGKLDGQSVMGKTPVGVARLAKKYDKPVIALAGSVMPEATVCNEQGIDSYFSILHQAIPLEKAMDPMVAEINLTSTAQQLFRLIKCFDCGGTHA